MMDCQGSTFVCKTRTVGAFRKPPRDAADRITTHSTKCFNLNNVDLVKLCPQQQNAIRFLHNIDFRCVLGDLGRFWKGTGFPEPNLQPVPRRVLDEALFRVQKVASPRFRRFPFSMGSAVEGRFLYVKTILVYFFRLLNTCFLESLPLFVERRFFYFESGLSYFGIILRRQLEVKAELVQHPSKCAEGMKLM